MHDEPADAWCVIGAGPSGLTALKNLRTLGLPATCLEREGDLGGNWLFGAGSSRILASTRLISSKSLTEYTDFKMPRHLPHHPGHRDCLEYLRAYARRFDLGRHIETGVEVERVEPAEAARGGGGWIVHRRGGPTRRYAGVVIASGHNHAPRVPSVPGHFSGRILHAADYKSPEVPVAVSGRRVLVVGGGNSGCDIAVEVSRHAAATFHSTRRGYHVVPRMVMGRPADLRGERLLKMGLPTWLRRLVALRLIDRAIGLPHRHGLPAPDHRLWETHPVINGELYSRITAGQITPTGDVHRFEGDLAVFADGQREPLDIVIFATGYRTAIPFIDPVFLCDRSGEREDLKPELYLNMLHPSRDDLACVGLIQPDSGQWGLTDLQGQLVARMAVAARRSPRAAAWLYRMKRRPRRAGPIRYVDSPRHRLEVEHHGYRRELQRLIAGLDRRLRSRHRGAAGITAAAVPAGGAAVDCRKGPRDRG